MNLHERLFSKVSLSSESPPTSAPSPYSTMPRGIGIHVGIALVSAFIGLFIFPEVFDSVAIILGAYAWKRQQGNLGLYIVILGIACLLIGLYLTASIVIGDLFA